MYAFITLTEFIKLTNIRTFFYKNQFLETFVEPLVSTKFLEMSKTDYPVFPVPIFSKGSAIIPILLISVPLKQIGTVCNYFFFS